MSIYGSSASHSTHHSKASFAAAKRAEAAVDLAAKEVECEEEKKQRERIQHLGEQQRTEVEAERREVERIQAEKNLSAARAKLQAFEQEAGRESHITD